MSVPPGPPAAPVVPGHVLEELLGRGGSGQVWRARPRTGGPAVAVKVLVRGDPERQEREAALLAELDHPHLVRLQQVLRHEVRGGPAEVALVLDLLAGGSLAALLARRGRLRPGEVVTTVAPIAAALAHAHERGIVHGDLSPGNVVFTAEGRPVLTDLGTARLVGDTARAEVTPPYVDPVVARGGAPGPASDVFGVAAAAFHALTGIAPWNAADARGTLAVAADGELPDLALLAPEAPDELVRVVRRGLSLEPHLRGTAAAFALDLRHACRPEPVQLPAPGVPDAEPALTGRSPHTELTHQVPGRRAGAAHAAAPPTRRGRVRARFQDRFRDGRDGIRSISVGRLGGRLAVLATALVVGAGGLAGAAWAGASWGGRADAAAVTDRPAAPVAAEVPVEVAAPAEVEVPAAEEAAPAAGAAVAASPAGPAAAGEAGWAAVLTALYERRATAFADADPGVLSQVYAPDSALLARDVAAVQALREVGRALFGFAPSVVRVDSVTSTPAGTELRLVDELPGYRVAPAGRPDDPTAQQVAGRGAAEVRLVLVPTAAGWRISDARVGA